jgi:hypothetical protein
LFQVHVVATHLSLGTLNWSVTIGGYSQTTNGTSLLFWEPAGTYAYTVGYPTGSHVPHPATGAFTVKGHAVTVRIRWS